MMSSQSIPSVRDMLVQERRQFLLTLIEERGRLVSTNLARELGVAPITVRKDIAVLASKGLVHACWGGALKVQQGKGIGVIPEKMPEITEAAIALIHEGDCLLLGSGSATIEIARGLCRFERVTVVTNDLNVARESADANLETILIGGMLQKNSLSVVGPVAEENLAGMHAQVLFLEVEAFDLELGATARSLLESRISRAMVKAAQRCVVICASENFNRTSLSHIVAPAAIHHVIIDSGLSKENADAIRALNIGLTITEFGADFRADRQGEPRNLSLRGPRGDEV